MGLSLGSALYMIFMWSCLTLSPLERVTKLSSRLGEGSKILLPIVETQLGDVSIYITTNVISIRDDQIFLLANLFDVGMESGLLLTCGFLSPK